MEDNKISQEEKEKLREMLRKTYHDRLESVARKSDKDEAGCMLGGMLGWRGYTILLLLSGIVNILYGIWGLADQSLLMPISPPLAWGIALLSIVFGIGQLVVGILNLIMPIYKVLLLNGIYLIVLGVTNLADFLLAMRFMPLIYFIIELALGIYFLRWYVQRNKWLRSRSQPEKNIE